MLLGVGALVFGGVKIAHSKPWPSKELLSAKSKVAYPLYYPAELPEGYSYMEGSLKPSEIATIYSIEYDKDKKLFISNQPKPKEVVFKDFYDRLLKNKADISSSQGKAVTGVIADQPVGSLVNDKTWVIINAPKGIDGQDLTTLVSKLEKL